MAAMQKWIAEMSCRNRAEFGTDRLGRKKMAEIQKPLQNFVQKYLQKKAEM
jgi:hypothetical protein